MRGSEDPDELLEMARSKEGGSASRRALARLLSVVEQGGAPARCVGRLTYEMAGGSYSVGLTGAPGSGKSTLTGRLVAVALRQGHERVAVLAIDPSSPLSGGAILGDRVRMQEHGLDSKVYIRSMASRGHLGGLAAAVPDAVRLFDACGWPLVLVETVGVGQVEVEVAGTCDTVVVVLNPGWGDAVQANKAGLLEVADVLVINKADRPGVRQTRRDLEHMLQLSGEMAWRPPIVETVASSGDGVDELLQAIVSHRRHLEEGGGLEARRRERLSEEMERLVADASSQLVAGILGRLAPRRAGIPPGEEEAALAAGRDLLERVGGRQLDPASGAEELGRLAARLSLSAARSPSP